eukprot:g2679.t1
MVQSSSISTSEALKEVGNARFKEGNFLAAVRLYTEALDALQEKSSSLREALYANRAACHLATEDYISCIDDCSSCLSLNAKHNKALYRRAQALERVQRLEGALQDYATLTSLNNTTKAAKRYAANARRLRDILDGSSNIGSDDPITAALKVLKNDTHSFSVKAQQIKIIADAVSDKEWAFRVVQKGALDVLLSLLSESLRNDDDIDMTRIVQHNALRCLAEISGHCDKRIALALRSCSWVEVSKIANSWQEDADKKMETKDGQKRLKRLSDRAKVAGLAIVVLGRVLVSNPLPEEGEEKRKNEKRKNLRKNDPENWLPEKLKAKIKSGDFMNSGTGSVESGSSLTGIGKGPKDIPGDLQNKIKRRDLKKLTHLERVALEAIVKGLDHDAPFRVHKSSTEAVLRIACEPMYAMFVAQPEKFGGGFSSLLALADVDEYSEDWSNNKCGLYYFGDRPVKGKKKNKSSLTKKAPSSTSLANDGGMPSSNTKKREVKFGQAWTGNTSQTAIDPARVSEIQPLHQRVSYAMARIFSTLAKYKEFPMPATTSEDEPDPYTIEWKAIHHLIYRAVVPLLESDREKDQVRGLRGMEAVWLVAAPVGLWMCTCDSMWTSAMSRLSFLSMSSRTDVQVLATKMIANVATHPEGRDQITDLVVRTLERLLDSDCNAVKASAALVVARQKHKDWNPRTPEGWALLEACIGLVKGPEQDRRAREQGIEALSSLCLKLAAKCRVVEEALPSIVQLANLGNEQSLHWFGIARLCYELSTNQLQKNAEKGRELEITGEQFETLQHYNSMKKPEDREPDPDTEDMVIERIKLMCANDVPAALARLSTAKSVHTREHVARTFWNMCRHLPARGILAQQGAITACCRLAQDQVAFKVSHLAAHALAQILISTNPATLKSHQVMNSAHVMLALCKSDEELAQFEALMALTNLLTHGMDVKEAVVQKNGMTQFELLQMSEHTLVKRAATEAVHNLIPCDIVFERMKENKGQLIDWWVDLGEDDTDFNTARAACGMLAMITRDPEICEIIIRRKLLKKVISLAISWDDDEISIRILTAIENVIDITEPIGSGLEQLKKVGAKKLLEKLEVEEEAIVEKLINLKGIF